MAGTNLDGSQAREEQFGATLLGQAVAPFVPSLLELDETAPGEGEAGASVVDPSAARPVPAETIAGRRTTVLPRRRRAETASGAAAVRSRFDRVRVLGEGAMGEVELARDNDIRRTVAVKRLHGNMSSEEALMRFADEVRIVGQLEHPSIVPIYDVGRDEAGKIYLVMKHLHGETMEQIIAALRSGDAPAREKYTIVHRAHLFLAVVDAIRYAHARGVMHRDLKPANIMIGPYGEVTVLDWGIAKPIPAADAPAVVEPLAKTAVDSHDARLLETRLGSVAGTPLYMSPEQAAGRNNEVDARSDVYALVMVLYEWLSLHHPLAGKSTVNEVLANIITHDYTVPELRDPAMAAAVPIEYVYLCRRGLARDRAQRFQSAAELEKELNDVLEGRGEVRCHISLAKRAAYGFLHWIDHHPGAYTLIIAGIALGLLGGVIYGVARVVRSLL